LAYRPRDVVVFECDPGYTLSGSPETHCQDDGRWDPPIPVCERRLRCRSPPAIDHGKPSGLVLSVFNSGMSVNYSCEPGYSLSGQASIYCTASGTWSPLPPRCEEIKCAFPEVQGGRKAVVGTTYRFGTNVTLECDNGYVLEGSSLIQCRHDFTWDPPVPVCKRTSLASSNLVSEVLGIIGGVLLLLLVITVIWKIVSKQNAGYYYTHENKEGHVPLTHIIEQKSSFAPYQVWDLFKSLSSV
ncbi:complement receptor type 2-like, partial [Emydura macquarii macquarii]|uniref:complement receptor type 2-like n=1 Tax=Emydura macquarii macquarii TaxID=1129001 RepID=UPI00352B5CFD